MHTSFLRPKCSPAFGGTANAPNQSSHSVLRVGLTGGIASGKSMITQFLQDAGIHTIDADHVVHGLLETDQALKAEIRQVFGDTVFTPEGEINRKQLGMVVFADPVKKKQLEGMIHPKVRQAIDAFFTQHQQDKLAVAVIPLLFESDLAQYYDVVWLVRASQVQQIDRLITTRGMTRAEALTRIQNQMPYDDKLKALQKLPKSAVIDNTGSPDETRRQVNQLIATA